MELTNNIILNTDSYKVSMFKQYPENTEGVYSYIESRGGLFDKVVFFGLQAFIKQYLLKPITQEEIDTAAEIMALHGEPFNREGWEYILKQYGGYLPVEIKAVPEGTVVPVKNVLVTIENIDPKCYWLTTHLETSLLRAIWYPTTVATVSKSIKNIILEYLEETGDPSLINFKLHDFGARGVSSMESAGLGGMAHLVNFMGTDTITGMLYAREYYNAGVAGFSIPAAEHSTITSWGAKREADAYRNMLKQFASPGALVAVVSDSYNIFHAADFIWGNILKQEVIDSGATVVIRPDSGDPDYVCTRLIEILGDRFGYTRNSKGYKVLNHVRIIQGDGINEGMIKKILASLKFNKWSADNIAFGMGGALLQQIDRDTQKFAMKCSAVRINGVWENVSKNPITDTGKKSKAGRVILTKNSNGEFETVLEGQAESILRPVFCAGVPLNQMNFEQVRENSNK